jgi:hypothetical protein
MISKELLLKVLGYTEDCRVLSIKEEYRDIKYDILSPVNGHYTERVNVYELAQRCKEWATTQGYWLHSHTRSTLVKDTYVTCGGAFVHLESNIRLKLFETESTTETEAIFLATQWVIDNKGQS